VSRFSVGFAEVAQRQVRAIEGWWVVNRTKAPGLFTQELEAAVLRLEEAPHAGSLFDTPRPANTRRMLLRRSGYHVYYTIEEQLATVTIRAVWHAARGRAPRLI